MIVSRVVEGESYNLTGFQRAFRALEEGQFADPVELRVSPQFFADYGADLVWFSERMGRPVSPPINWASLQFNGVPVIPDESVAPMGLQAVFVTPETHGDAQEG